MANNITIAKGGISVDIQVERVDDNFANQFFIIKPAQATNNQGDGPKEVKVVDLLRVTHSILIKGHITSIASKTALAVKQDLVNIWKGAGATGGVVTLTYDENASAFGNTAATNTNPISGFIEKVNFQDISMDEPSDFDSAKENYQDISKFEVTITFIEGTNI